MTIHRPTATLPSLLVVVVALLLLGACAGDAGTDDPTEPPPTSAPTDDMAREDLPVADGSPGALSLPATGVLGVADVEGGCTYVEIEDERYQLMAGPDADVVVDPANGVVASTDGEVIAGPGDTVIVDGQVDPGMMTFCQIGPVLVASGVEAG